jgi:menaquinone-dependent protoporphyrinogen oxidase
MKIVGVLYASREGHTQRIAEHVAADLRMRGLHPEVENVRDRSGAVNLRNYSGVILAASVHAGSHESEMVKFVKAHRRELEDLPTAFLSISLSEAGAERSDATPADHAQFVADVEQMINKFFMDTGWHTERVKPVAGALLYTRYNVLLRFVMKRIARKSGGSTDTSRDHIYTDWQALDQFVDEFAREIPQIRQ